MCQVAKFGISAGRMRARWEQDRSILLVYFKGSRRQCRKRAGYWSGHRKFQTVFVFSAYDIWSMHWACLQLLRWNSHLYRCSLRKWHLLVQKAKSVFSKSFSSEILEGFASEEYFIWFFAHLLLIHLQKTSCNSSIDLIKTVITSLYHLDWAVKVNYSVESPLEKV